MDTTEFLIDERLVVQLLSTQFPSWASLPIVRITPGGWDNRTFRLGADMLVRVPSASDYAASVTKEQHWLPRLAPHLPLQIPQPLAAGRPGCGLAWEWSIYRWLPGVPLSSARIEDMTALAADLARCLTALHEVDTTGGPRPGPENFHRGGDLAVYDAETRQAIDLLSAQIDGPLATSIWELALKSPWRRPPVWVHGDISAGNLLTLDDALVAVIDFGQMAIGDPACDLVIAWTLFEGLSRESFRRMLPLDDATWARARGWALWKALIVASRLSGTDPDDVQHPWRVIAQLLGEHQ